MPVLLGMGMRGLACAAALAAILGAAMGSAGTARAETLRVGPDRPLKAPSEAARVARDGDRVEIEPGEYFDCAVWTQNRLQIVGTGPGVVLTDRTCEGKAIFVIRGTDARIQGITFTRARVPDGNGAGIRAEGRNLTVEESRFVNNENGILTSADPESTVVIRRSEFARNGSCEKDCAHGIYVNTARLLRIEDSTFRETKTAHHVKSRALRTEILGTTIEDGDAGTSSYLVDIPNGGSLVIADSTLQKGPKTSNRRAAVMIGAEGVTQPTREITVRGSRFDGAGRAAGFIVNMTATEAVLAGNSIRGVERALIGDGMVQ
ncbi:right-handed parallel beta-helix repeat-containing protein [Arenibaculum pallidiluteum]|uniref:right-handed parallel beta-helix repeat-containing protein n=1 Tax=Arenibaculum pallidiluteum TaxID=2812559 RepID=UPI001A96D94D|nr:right-handed parallel beta-helix repeat-containing protein [Arenibaculum pallidiluteum]